MKAKTLESVMYRRSIHWTVCFVVAMVFSSTFSMAADWYVTPRFELDERYDSNILVTKDDKKDDFITYVRPKVEAGYRTERFQSAFNTYAEYQKFIKEDELDTIHHDHRLSLGYALLQTLNLRASGFFRVDTTLDTELLEEGRLARREDRQRFGGTAGLDYVFSPVFLCAFDVGRDYTRYPDDPVDTADYWSDSVTLVPQYILNPKTSFFVSLGYYKTKYDNLESDFFVLVDRRIETFNIMPYVTYRFTEDFNAKVGAGYRYTQTEGKSVSKIPFFPDENQDGDSSGFIANLVFHKDWQQSFMELDLSRDQYSSLEGDSLERDRASLRGSYTWSERFRTHASLDYVRATSDEGGDDSSYIYVTPSMDFRWTREVTLRGFFNYTYYDETDSTDRYEAGLKLIVAWERLFSGH
ncbi:MAG: outer membrane beta-barrel protein [Deltaproteobacteria bacterium]|nr:outer membrane beta-barrel protein [Deltaproteobacteria bacterium]